MLIYLMLMEINVDFVQSWGPLIFGHCDKDIEKQLLKLQKRFSFGAPTLLETQLANEIVEMYDNIDKSKICKFWYRSCNECN